MTQIGRLVVTSPADLHVLSQGAKHEVRGRQMLKLKTTSKYP